MATSSHNTTASLLIHHVLGLRRLGHPYGSYKIGMLVLPSVTAGLSPGSISDVRSLFFASV